MFRKTRWKIVAAIMSILVTLWVGTLTVIYASSYLEMTQRNQQMLRAHTDLYLSGQPLGEPHPALQRPEDLEPGPRPGFNDWPIYRLTTFYTVVLSGGEVQEIVNLQPMVYTDQELAGLALDIAQGRRDAGTADDLAFYRTERNGLTLVAFMDNTVVNRNADTLFRNTLAFGGLALAVFFCLSVVLARWIVRPIEQTFQKQKQFISDAGHELKTPVSVVEVNAELLSREIGESPWLANIQYENQRMSTLVAQLLDLARTEQASVQKTPVDLSRLVSGEVLPFESVAFERGLELDAQVAPGITVEGDDAQLRQAVSVLLDNAISHSDRSGAVQLRLVRVHNHAVLTVTNPGSAIPPEVQKRLFDRFYRRDDARGGSGGHYGLGLSIAKAVAERHRGRIDVRCDGGLVEFTLTLPALSAAIQY